MVVIVNSALDVTRRILDPKLPISPCVIAVRSTQGDDVARTIYANSITLHRLHRRWRQVYYRPRLNRGSRSRPAAGPHEPADQGIGQERLVLAASTVAAAGAVLIAMALTLIRALRGPTVYDRILAANMFGTLTVLRSRFPVF
jgi:hypothetical protein